MFVVFEGGDAVGKATQAARFRATRSALCYRRRVIAPFFYSFPRYDTPVGRVILRHLQKSVMLTEERSRDSSDIRIDGYPYYARAPEDPLAFQCLMLADKMEAAPGIRRQIADNGDVIVDRWWPSAFAYGGSDGLPDKWLIDIHQILPPPDLMLFFDLPVEVAIERAMKRAEIKGRKLDRYETLERQTAVRLRYLCLIAIDPLPWHTIDATGTEDEVAARVEKAVEDYERIIE